MPVRQRRLTRWLIGIAAGLLLPATAFLLLVAWPLPPPPTPPSRVSLAITGVDVVDLDAGRLLRDRTVLLTEGRILSVQAGDAAVPGDYRRIDARGKYLMPALWDMHVHVHALSPMLDLPLYVANGVTRVRDMQGCPRQDDPFIACSGDKARWTAEALAGQRVAPRIIESTSFMANGPGMAVRVGGVPAYFDAATPAQARAFVRHFAATADSIKVYDRIPRAAYLALADEARRHGLPVVGHRPHAVSALEAVRHQRSLEHARFLLHEGYDGAEALRVVAGTPAWREDRRSMVDRHDPARSEAIFEAMRAAGTYYVPTHLTRWADAYAETPAVLQDPALATLHPLLRMQWREDVVAVVDRDPSPEARRAYRDFHRLGLVLTGRAHRAGVKVMVGTDYIGAGSDAHREMALLVDAGLSNLDALRAATVVPAEYAGLADHAGRVLPGHSADLVLLDADPLRDIRHTRRIHAVVFDGRLLDPPALQAIHAHARAAARSWSVGAKILWRFVRQPVAY